MTPPPVPADEPTPPLPPAVDTAGDLAPRSDLPDQPDQPDVVAEAAAAASAAVESAAEPIAEPALSASLSARSSKHITADILSMPDLADTFDEPTLVGLRQKQKLFENRFELQQKLGSGGMGQVWRAKDLSLNEDVALKFLPPFLQDDPLAVEELKRETKNGRSLSHPNIVKIHGLQLDERANHCAVEMELVDGQTLGQLRVQKPNLVFEASELNAVLIQLLSALDYAHEDAGLVHRDLKPANLMLTRDGRLKVTDFGISRTLADGAARATIAGRSAGTLCYMSPQQARGEKASASDDIYGLASTLYDLLTGRPPFFQGNIAGQLVDATAPTLISRRAEFGVTSREPIPEHWESAIARCLLKTREQRPQSIREVAALFGIALDGGATRPQPQPIALGAGYTPALPTGFATTPPSHGTRTTHGSAHPQLPMMPPALGTQHSRGTMPTVSITAPRDQLRPVNDLAREAMAGAADSTGQAGANGKKRPVALIAAAVIACIALVGVGGMVVQRLMSGGSSIAEVPQQKPDAKPENRTPPAEPSTPSQPGTPGGSLPAEMPAQPGQLAQGSGSSGTSGNGSMASGTSPGGGTQPTQPPSPPPPTADVPSIEKLQKLVDSTPTGQAVILPSGIYQGQLLLRPGQNVAATAIGQVTIESTDRTKPALIISGGKGTRAANLVLRFSLSDAVTDLPRTELVRISGEATLEKCHLTNAIGDALSIASGGPVNVTDCVIEKARFCGVIAQAGSTSILDNLRVSGVGESAIDLRNSGTRATITKADLTSFKFTGIVIRDGAEATLNECSIVHHSADDSSDPITWAESGVSVAARSRVRITKGNISRNQRGLVVTTGSHCEAIDLVAQANQQAGIWMLDADPQSSLKSCTAAGSDCGIGITSTSGGTGPRVEECIIKQNVFGMYIEGPAFAPQVLRNQITENVKSAITLTNCGGTYEANILRGNGSDTIDRENTTPELKVQ